MDDVTQGRVVEHSAGANRLGALDGDGTRTTDIDIRLTSGPSSAAAARTALNTLERRVHPVVLGDLRLLVSELVTNSVRHSEAEDVRLRVSLAGERVRVEVSDTGRGFTPAPQARGVERVGGWGLYLVERLADRWGVARDGLTRVWFEMDGRTPSGGGAPILAV